MSSKAAKKRKYITQQLIALERRQLVALVNKRLGMPLSQSKDESNEALVDLLKGVSNVLKPEAA